MHALSRSHLQVCSRALVVSSPVQHPPQPHDHSQAGDDDAGVVHRLGRGRQAVREAIDDYGDDDIEAGNGIDGGTKTAHPEGSRLDELAARHQVRQDGKEVRQRRQHDERAYEGVERRQ